MLHLIWWGWLLLFPLTRGASQPASLLFLAASYPGWLSLYGQEWGKTWAGLPWAYLKPGESRVQRASTSGHKPSWMWEQRTGFTDVPCGEEPVCRHSHLLQRATANETPTIKKWEPLHRFIANTSQAAKKIINIDRGGINNPIATDRTRCSKNKEHSKPQTFKVLHCLYLHPSLFFFVGLPGKE